MRSKRGAAATVLLLLAACGGSGASGDTGSVSSAPVTAGAAVTTGAPVDPLEVRPESAGGPLPAVTVRHVQTGDEIQLANLLPAAKPLLVWFWAPH